MNNEVHDRLMVILVKEHHLGFASFMAENFDAPSADWCVRQWDTLAENEKLAWDILVELEGGTSEVLKVLKVKREKVLKMREKNR